MADRQTSRETDKTDYNNPEARFPSKRNRLRCVCCVWMETGLNASANCIGKQPIMVATASTEHPIGCNGNWA